tara:strand:- start:240 stop:563 length:324 start_codon:yes stop_codon:yes gene_type:complete
VKEPAQKIVFYDTEKRKAELKIKLHSDGLSQADFFRSVISAYISEEDNFMKWFEEHFNANSKIRSKAVKGKTSKQRRKAQQIKASFGLDTEEIENIFDILEQEHPDL